MSQPLRQSLSNLVKHELWPLSHGDDIILKVASVVSRGFLYTSWSHREVAEVHRQETTGTNLNYAGP